MARTRTSARPWAVTTRRSEPRSPERAGAASPLPVARVVWPSAGRRRPIPGIRRPCGTGAPWRDLPVEYGPWRTVHGLSRRWQGTGVRRAVQPGVQPKAASRKPVRGLIRCSRVRPLAVCSAVRMARTHDGAPGRARGRRGPTGPAPAHDCALTVPRSASSTGAPTASASPGRSASSPAPRRHRPAVV